MSDDRVTAYLAGVRERYNAGADFPLAGDAKAITDSSDDVPRLVAAVEAVLAQHKRDDSEAGWCEGCDFGWPCQTYRTISAALLRGGDE